MIKQLVHLTTRRTAAANLFVLGAVALTAACGGAGMGATVRTDITTQMNTANGPISACYNKALQANRRLRGYMVLSLAADPGTGKFVDAYIVRDELNDDTVRRCVLDEVAKLKLAKPQRTRVVFNYPIHFQPTK